MIRVKSSNVRSVGYDADTRTLTVEFHSGARYAYADVPSEEHEALLAATSIGAHLATKIKGVYAVTKLEREAAS
jgi:hypothetical protein